MVRRKDLPAPVGAGWRKNPSERSLTLQGMTTAGMIVKTSLFP
ncbi:MAG: hypothetical protein ACXAEU_05705 [Candidatus Hodarchaeales archaeon]